MSRLVHGTQLKAKKLLNVRPHSCYWIMVVPHDIKLMFYYGIVKKLQNDTGETGH